MATTGKAKSLKTRIVFPLVTLALTFLLIEAALQAFALAVPRAYLRLLGTVPPAVKDRKLGMRPNPDFPDHDQKGFPQPKRVVTGHDRGDGRFSNLRN